MPWSRIADLNVFSCPSCDSSQNSSKSSPNMSSGSGSELKNSKIRCVRTGGGDEFARQICFVGFGVVFDDVGFVRPDFGDDFARDSCLARLGRAGSATTVPGLCIATILSSAASSFLPIRTLTAAVSCFGNLRVWSRIVIAYGSVLEPATFWEDK